MSAQLPEVGERAGPLREVALRFLETHRAAPPRADLSLLGHAIDGWAESDDATSDEDDAFVEGAGALLGLLLIEWHGGAHAERAGEHRVHLGEDGFFDPFGAIDEALEDPVAFAAALSRAEGEASARTGVGRAVARFRSRLRHARPDRSVTARFGPSLTLDDGVEIDLAAVIRATSDQAESAVDQAIDKLLSMLPGGEGAPSRFEDLAACVLPRLLSRGFLSSLGPERSEHLARRSAASGALELGLIAHHTDRARYLRRDELTAWRMSFDDVLSVAMTNLASRSKGARLARVETDVGPIIVARTGDGLDAARLLLPSLAEVLASEIKTPCIASVPHRDTLLACANEPALVDALARKTRDDAARAPHAITDRLFVIGDGALRPLSDG